jgi:two-component system chemotaxis response regulator CheB
MATRAASARGNVKLIVIGASTGGPQALTRLLGALPADLPCPAAVALHIPAGYTEALAARLNASCAVRVFEASEGAELTPGSVAIARGGSNLRVRRSGNVLTAHLDERPTALHFLPSVDVLLESAAAACSSSVLAVVLTGMGSDGLVGARAVTQAGGLVLTEAESSCVVYGMPRSVVEAGLSAAEVPIEDMAQAILDRL